MNGEKSYEKCQCLHRGMTVHSHNESHGFYLGSASTNQFEQILVLMGRVIKK